MPIDPQLDFLSLASIRHFPAIHHTLDGCNWQRRVASDDHRITILRVLPSAIGSLSARADRPVAYN
jgi:hypothetical protein